MRRLKLIRAVTIVCVLSLCLNGIFLVRNIAQRSSNMRGMDMTPYYLSLALNSYSLEFEKNRSPNVHFQPGRPSIDMAFSAYQAAEPLFNRYGFKNTVYVYDFLYNLYFLSSDRTAYHELLGIKSFLPNHYLTSSEIQRLFSAIAKEYQQSTLT